MTVYDRLKAHTEATGFKWHPHHKKWVGSEIAKAWRNIGGTMEELEVIQSVEDDGTWMVFSYPEGFQLIMERTIVVYANKLLRPKPLKIIEKPVPEKPSEPQKRKRKPIQKPVFSSRNIKK